MDTSLIQRRHNELATELQRRGMNHDSPLNYKDDLNLGSIDTAANRDDLKERCEECRQRIEAADTNDGERGPD